MDDATIEVRGHCRIRESYGPEIGLARWLRQQAMDDSVYCFHKVGARPLRRAYELLARTLELDAIVLVHGDVDAVLRGSEHSLGTPTFDHVSVAAASALDLPVKVLACVGFGAERYDGISHAQALNRFADLVAVDALLGVECYLLRSRVVERWLEALAHIYQHRTTPSASPLDECSRPNRWSEKVLRPAESRLESGGNGCDRARSASWREACDR